MPHVSHFSKKDKHVEQDGNENVKEGMVAPEDGIVHLGEIDTMQCDVARTPKGTLNTFPTSRVHSVVEIGNNSEPSGQIEGDLHKRRYMPSLSPRRYYKNGVSFLLLNSDVIKLCSG